VADEHAEASGTVTEEAPVREDEAKRDDPSAQRSVRKLDFSQPTKFTPDVRRRLAATLSDFCADLAEQLSEELHCEVELEVDDVAQHTWAGAKARLAADSFAVAVEADAPERQMLLSVEPALILQALECMLGGEAGETPPERALSEVDWALAKDLLDRIVAELSSSWTELGGAELTRGEIDLEGDAGLLTPPSEPTLALSVRSRIGPSASAMSLLIGWPAVEPLLDALRGVAATAGHLQISPHDHDGGVELRRGLAVAQVLLRAEVGSMQMPIERMLAIVPGTLVELGERAEEGVRLFAEEVLLGRGRPGRSGTRRAIQLETSDEPPARSETYARLGRSELERARAHAAEAADGAPILRSIFVRVWAELGRTHMSLGGALELSAGGVVELDQAAQAPVELFANGLCFANGSLVVSAEGAWGVQVEALV
jgi:flagellar motor switch protein FliM